MLVKDRLSVCEKLTFLLPKEPKEESLAIATLFHDLCNLPLFFTMEREKNMHLAS